LETNRLSAAIYDRKKIYRTLLEHKVYKNRMIL